MNEATNTPLSVTLADGKDYLLPRISPNIWAEFEEQVNRWEGRTPSKGVEFDELIRWAQNARGARWLLWKCLRKAEHKVDLETAGDLSGSIPKLFEIIQKLMDMPTEEGAEGSDSDPLRLTGTSSS